MHCHLAHSQRYQQLLTTLTTKGLNVELTTFVRKPFTVEAVEITEENINELAEFIGTVRTKDNGSPYIQVDRRLVPNVFRVYPGFWMTKMGDNIRCYSKRIFKEQFVETTSDIEDWVNFLNGDKESVGANS
ncbi:MAG: hypothetical protein ABWY25_06085 [Paenisporosarcina sp.]